MKKILIIILCLFATSAFAFSFFSNEKKQELNQVNQQIEGLQSTISAEQSREQILQNGLQSTEVAISVLSVKLTSTSAQLENLRQNMALLAAQESTYQLDYHQQQQILAQSIQAAYMLGQNNYVKLLLNQDDANKISRMLIYYKYFNTMHMQTLKNMQITLNNVASTQQKMQTNYQQIQFLQNEQQKSQQNLQGQLQQRQTILTQLNSSLQSKDQQLATLQANKQALEQLVTKLTTPTPTTITFKQPLLPFANMKGKLAWPTQGKITEHFGASVDDTSVTSAGVFISAAANQPVRAIYPGRVVFAGWLRGIGMLIILDQGDGYMTLYGHNGSLYRKVGDVVKAGDEIANVGYSGGDDKSGLYFQIRANGQPLDPEQWCH